MRLHTVDLLVKFISSNGKICSENYFILIPKTINIRFKGLSAISITSIHINTYTRYNNINMYIIYTYVYIYV